MKIKKEFKINPFSTKKLNFMTALFVCFSLLAIAMVPITQKGNATTNDDTTSFVSVDEIWNAENETFNENTLDALLQYITNDADVTASDITAKGSLGDLLSSSTAYSDGALTSAEIRKNTVNGKTTSQDIQITFGGLTWQVVYLTKDKQGNDILTLWLSNNKQDAWAGRSATEGTLYGFIDGALYSDWSNDIFNYYYTVNYPTNMYGTSYINAVTLNNGGAYISSQSGSYNSSSSTMALTTNVPQDENNVFAMFTMDSVAGSVTEYLVTPNNVGYQETENAYAEGCSYTYGNDAYGIPAGSTNWDDGRYGSAENMLDKAYYDAWASSYIWLPSMAEAGDGNDGTGLWRTSQSQRANNSSSDNQINTGVGSSNTSYGTYIIDYSWLRSGFNASASTALHLSASNSNNSSSGVGRSYAVRPALHLNLNDAASNALYPTDWDGTSTEAPTLQDPAQANSEDNPYIIDSAAKLAWISANFDQPNCYGQHYLQTVNIDLASHPWTPINNTTASRAYYYDGGNHTISNLYINTSEQDSALNNNLGLFGYVFGSSSNHAYIKNLGIVNGSIAGEDSGFVGAVGGYTGYTDITNCYNEKTDITITGSSGYIGGVVGHNHSGTISSSYNTGAVSGEDSVGGVVGINYSGTISSSYNTGEVTGGGSVGGVAGQNDEGTVSGSYNTGTVSGSREVGGVAGNNKSGTIRGSYNTGAVSGDDSVGGVAGYNYYGTISGSYNDGDITGSSNSVGGVAGYNNYGTISSSYNTGTVSGGGYVGGVVGGNSSGTISGSYNTGIVSGYSYVGGVAGYNEGTVSSSYNTGTVSGVDLVGGVVGRNDYGTISSSYNTGAVSGSNYVGGVVGYVIGSSSDKALISSCFSTGAITRTSGSSTDIGGVVGYIENSTSRPSQYVSISWCYYNTETVGSVVTKAIGRGTGYQVYGLTTAQMQGDKNQNYMYLSDTIWNFASGSYPTLKYVAQAQN